MAIPSFLLAGVVILFVLGIVAWAIQRRRTPAPAASARPRLYGSPVPPAGSAPAGGNQRQTVSHGSGPADAGQAQERELLQRLYAIVFDDASFSHDGVIAGTVHADLVARAVSILGRIETQPRYTPRRPQLLPQLMRTVNDPNASGQAMAAIIAQDPVLTGNLLRIASSALYCVQHKPVENLTHAVAMVGTDGIRQLIATALVQPVMGGGAGAFGGLAGIIWEHTLLSSAAAADHATLVEGDDAFSAQLLGLMQGLGSATVARVTQDQYARHRGLVPDASVAAALLDGWATPVARRVAQKWELPPRIRETLEQQGNDAPDSLGRSLRFGCAAGALALLCRHGRVDDAEALRILATIECRNHATAGIWQRLRRSVAQAA